MPRPEPLVLARWAMRFCLCCFCFLVTWTIAGANVAWGVLLASLVAFAALGGTVALGAHRSAIEIPLWVFLGAAILACALGVDPAHSFRSINKDVHKVFIYTLFSIALATELAPQGLACMAAGFAVAGGVGIRQGIGYLATHQYWYRAHALVHPVTFGEQMAVATLGAVSFLALPEGILKTSWQRWLARLVLVVTAAALVLSETRAALLGLLAGLAVISFFIRRLRLPLGLALLVVALAMPFMERARYGRALMTDVLLAQHQGTIQAGGQLERLLLWRVAWSMGKDHFWTGVGIGNFRAMLPHYLSAKFSDGTNSWGTAHNLYLHTFAERGVLGLCALVWLLGALWLRAWQRTRQEASPWNLWALGTATAFLVMNMTEEALQVEIVWMLVFFVWVWAEARHRQREGSWS
ncbi:MAG: O-antigen ligase family protein [Elusimicrobia bacterium]|nr:O-antigen ligase family protein [Elusimicrobiota bacterium]